MRRIVKWKSKTKIITVLTVMMVFAGLISISARGEDEAPAPATSKTLTDNGDGTYNLNLSVTGSASSTTTSNKADVIVIFDRSGSMNDSMGGNGSGVAPLANRRITHAKTATNSLAETLLALNTTEQPDNVRIALVSFSSTATQTSFTTNLSTFQSRVNNLSASGATNWEDALRTANNMQTRADADVHVIFVSDGDPTVRLTRGTGNDPWRDYRSRTSNGKTYYGSGTDDPNNNNYNYAQIQAQNIVNSDKNFYSIGVSNDVTRMQGLATSVGEGDNYYHVTDSQSMQNAFSSIVSSITDASNFQNVVINDGITAATSSVVLSDGATASDYIYTIASPTGASYTIELNESGEITSINGATDEVTLTDSVLNSYTLRVGDSFPAAAKSGNGVQWDLSAIGRLLNGYTYTVSFRVWPSQEAYDTLADLLNGEVDWNDVDQSQYTRTDNGDGTYSYGLRTNTNASVSYDHVREVTGEDPVTTSGEAEFDDVPSIPLTATTMDVRKEWNGEMPANADASVTFEIYRDGESTGNTVVLSSANNWTSEIYIAPGIQVGDEILETGHEYEVQEILTSGFEDYHYEFETRVQHPMIIDGVLTLFGGNNALIGINHRKSHLNITKTINDISLDQSADPDELFTFEIEVTENAGDDVWFSIGDGESHTVVEGDRVSGATAEIQSGETTGYYFMPSGSTATVKIKSSENIYLTNLSTGSIYQITEVALPVGYTNTGITGNGANTVDLPVTEGTVAASNTTYHVSYTNEFNVANIDQEILTTKKVEGRNATEQFEFALVPSASTQTAIDAGEIVVAEGANTAVTTTSGFIAKDGQEEVSFGKYSFYREGIYTFTIDETTTTSAPGWLYDASTHEVTVTVTKNNNGALVAAISNNNPVFTNTYTADPVQVSIPVEKIRAVPEGLTAPDIVGQFTFTLASVDNAPMPSTGSTQVTNPDADGGVASFGSITYSEAGTYYYDVTETGLVAGYQNDPDSTKRIAVVVTDGGEGQLVATVNNGRNITFTNTYSVGATSASITIRKNLVADEGLNPPDITGAYTFTLKDSDGNVIEAKQNPDANGGSVTFSPITYMLPGTYTYTVEESGSVDAVENDPVLSKTVTVTVTDNYDGTMTAVASAVEFNNTYSVSPTRAQIVVTKNLIARTGLTPPDITGAYSFTLTDSEGTIFETKQNPDADGGNIAFTAIEYTAPGTYIYTVEETGDVQGVNNDPTSSKTVTVTVRDNGDGTLSASSTTAAFTNTYDATAVTASIPVRKVLDAAEGLTAPDITGKYEFVLSAVAGAPLANESGSTISTSVINDPSNEMIFEAIRFTTPGTYRYVIRENNVGTPLDGITNDPSATTGKSVSVVVTDNGDGTLSASVVAESAQGASDTTVFTNTYSVSPITAQIPVEKILASADGLNVPNIAGQFTFTLAAIDSAPLPDNVTITNPNADGGVASFGAITYTTAGTYEYTITESGTVPGVENDTDATKTIEVIVTDNGNGTLSASVNSGHNVLFTNTYSAAEVSIVPYVRKVMEIPDHLSGPEEGADAFTFTITAEDGTPLPEITSIGLSSRGETKQFGEITFAAPGTYRYIVTETGSLPGVTNDTLAADGKELIITVTDNGQGQLVAVSSATEEEPLTFTNEYDVEEEESSITDMISVTKEMTGAKPIEADAYEFVLVSTDDGSSMSLTAKNDADGHVTFDAITFTEPGEYHYAISEVNGGQTIDGVYYDNTVYNVTANVTDDAEGGLSVTWTAENAVEDITFTNQYTADDVAVGINANKRITGDRTSLYEGETYSFTLIGISENTEGAELTASNTLTGEISFEEITYTQTGIYEYEIRETSQSGNGIMVDSTVHHVIVTVTDDYTGQLAASVNYPEEGFIFTNTYTLEPISSGITAFKKVTGMELEAGAYSFVMEPVDDAPGEVQTVTNDAYGNVDFAPIQFTEPGTYIYTVSEVKGDQPGVSYDATPRSVIATVTDNLDGTLSVSWETGDLTFTNSYAEATIRIGATKTIRGRDWNPEIDVYEFALKAEDGTVMQTVTNDAAGNITFEPFTVYEAGEYTYTIEEISESANGVTTDSTVYTVKVTVTEDYEVQTSDGSDTGDDTSLTGNAIDHAEPVNEEPLAEVEEPSDVAEEMMQETPIDGEEAENTVLTAEDVLDNTYETESEVDMLPQNSPEEIVEVEPETELTGAMIIPDEPIRVLKADVTYLTEDGSAPRFINTYTTTPYSSSIHDSVSIQKVLNGREMKAGEFTFALRSEESEQIKTNNADGSVVFDSITFSEPGRYDYTISEISGDDANIVYDGTIYYLTAFVEDNLDGTLSLVWEVSEEEIVFSNTYLEPKKDEPKTPSGSGKSVKSVKTGDDARSGFYLILLLLASILFAMVTLEKRRRNR